jgi:hypothetical protein
VHFVVPADDRQRLSPAEQRTSDEMKSRPMRPAFRDAVASHLRELLPTLPSGVGAGPYVHPAPAATDARRAAAHRPYNAAWRRACAKRRRTARQRRLDRDPGAQRPQLRGAELADIVTASVAGMPAQTIDAALASMRDGHLPDGSCT